MENVEIRRAVPGDEPVILGFIRELAEYEHMSDEVVATEELLHDWLFEKRAAEVLFAVEDGKEVGFALFFGNFSTFLGRGGIYLEDLFVKKEHRGHGYSRALLRALAQAADEISNMVYEGGGTAESILEAAERKIFALGKDRKTGGLEPVATVVQRVYDGISEAALSENSTPGISTGIRELDGTILGMGPGDFILVASRPGMGKTSIGLNIALSAAKSTGKTVAVFSLEMTREQLVMRLLAGEGLVDSKKLQTGRLSDDEWRRVGTAAGALSATDIRIDDNPSLTVSEMNAQCRRLKNLGLIVIDYLQLMQSAGSGNSWANESRTQAVSDISRMIKIMAKELGVPVLCLSQLSRANESRQNKRPMLSDLRESGAIEQDADVVMGIYREGYYNQECENPNDAELIILKNRRGQTGTINLMWLPEYTSFVAVDRRHDDD